MSKAALSIFVYSFYLFLMGLGMIIIPNILLGLFGFEPTHEVWIRMLGVFTFTTGIYYFQSSRNEQNAFFKATVIGRIFFFLATLALVFILNQSKMLILIASADLLGATWTGLALRTQKSN
ncbi:hypothetical protein V9L05_06945 [Bernardetia sp. Wsw4-3y2]|uniref:hypothetical protein n=1 Tax=Bernardetia sp. Wsw4-3y2 TaxID=3127471 RepID=UPI0030CBBD5D